MSQLPLKPSRCPVCAAPMQGKLLVCSDCWWKVPTQDRIKFHRLYTRDSRPQVWFTKAAQIIRDLKAMRRNTQ